MALAHHSSCGTDKIFYFRWDSKKKSSSRSSVWLPKVVADDSIQKF